MSLPLAVQEVQEDLSQLMKLRQATPEFQLSMYPPGGSQYVRHRDAFPDDGSDENQRKVLGSHEFFLRARPMRLTP